MKTRLLTCISRSSSSGSSIVDRRVYPSIHKTVNYSIHLFQMDVLRFQHLHACTRHTHIHIRLAYTHDACAGLCARVYVYTRVQLNEFFSIWHPKWRRMRSMVTFTITLTITFTVCKRCQCFNWALRSECIRVCECVLAIVCVCASRKHFWSMLYVHVYILASDQRDNSVYYWT